MSSTAIIAAKDKTAKRRATKASRANGTGKPNEPAKDKARNGKPSRLEPRPQTYFLSQHGGPGRGGRPIDAVLSRLQNVTQSGPGQWSACCPAHADSSPSLSVSEGDDGRVLFYCHSGCTIDEVVEALGLNLEDLFARRKQDRAKNGQRQDPPQRSKLKTAKPKTRTANTTKKKAVFGLRTAPGSKRDWAGLASSFEDALSDKQLVQLEKKLKVPRKYLRLLHVGWRNRDNIDEQGCYTFPEMDGAGRVIGINRRYRNGKKQVIGGGNRGLYLPAGWRDRPGPILICEGPSDTAALAAMGLAGIGRPSATSGGKYLAELLADVPESREIIVLGELDAKSTGKWPGREGAIKVAGELAAELGRTVFWALAPDGRKDVRDWLISQKEAGHG